MPLFFCQRGIVFEVSQPEHLLKKNFVDSIARHNHERKDAPALGDLTYLF
jgi:heat shock protein HspQ